MDYKTICVIFVALTILSVNANNNVNVNTGPVLSDVASSESSGPAVAYLRSKRQYPFGGGFGGSNAFSSASAVAGAGGLGGFGGSNAFSSANAGAGGYGLYGKK